MHWLILSFGLYSLYNKGLDRHCSSKTIYSNRMRNWGLLVIFYLLVRRPMKDISTSVSKSSMHRVEVWTHFFLVSNLGICTECTFSEMGVICEDFCTYWCSICRNHGVVLPWFVNWGILNRVLHLRLGSRLLLFFYLIIGVFSCLKIILTSTSCKLINRTILIERSQLMFNLVKLL